MFRKIVLGGIVSGLILFIWCIISWMVLPLHAKTLQSFSNESAIAQSLAAHASAKGVFILPNAPEGLEGEAKKAALKASHAQMEKGPFAFVAYAPEGSGPLKALMLRALIIQILASWLLCLMLSMAGLASYVERLGFCLLFAVTASFFCFIPSWNWWAFPPAYVMLECFDLIAGLFLSGLVLARIIR